MNYCCIIKHSFSESLMPSKRTLCALTLIAVSGVCLFVYQYLSYGVNLHHFRSERTANTSSKLPQQKRDVVNVIEVHSRGNLTHRITAFNAFLTSFRLKHLQITENSAWQMPTLNQLSVVFGKEDDYLQQLYHHSSVTTVVLPWLVNSSFPSTWSSLEDTSNVLIQKYYSWTADDRFCSWFNRSLNSTADKCNTDINDSSRPFSLQRKFHSSKRLNRSQYSLNGGYTYALSYIHIHRDAIVTKHGDIVSGNLELILHTCSTDTKPSKSLGNNFEHIPLYNELFVISQFWGTEYFHRMIEVLPRIVVYVDFLKANPQIRILVPEVRGRIVELLQIIGLPKSRLVAGVSRAKIVYQPKSTPCGTPTVPESQLLSKLYRNYIERSLSPQPRNRLILIRRSGSRRFTEQKEIENLMKGAASDFNLTYTLFIDNPPPSLSDTMRIFHSAVMIVAPLGAGEANMIFSQPGTYVIEGICNPPYVILCFQRSAYVLGHHWHAIMSRRGCMGVVDVSAASVDNAVHRYLRVWKLQHSS